MPLLKPIKIQMIVENMREGNSPTEKDVSEMWGYKITVQCDYWEVF